MGKEVSTLAFNEVSWREVNVMISISEPLVKVLQLVDMGNTPN
jgi:hypothetical protein